MIDQVVGSIAWGPFLVVVLLAYLIPGPDLLIILRSSTRGWRSGVAAAAGAQTGLCAHMLLAVAGLSIVLTRYPITLTVVRVLGAAYLLYLALRLLRSSGVDSGSDPRGTGPFSQGLLTNLLNPKAALFFFSVLPQFVAATGPVQLQVLTLGIVDILVGFLPWALVVTGGVRLAPWLQQPHRRRRWDRVAGAVMAVLALWLLASQ